MGTLERIIYEAQEAGKEKQRQQSAAESRRPSTTVGENGMMLHRGFLPPSRSPSQDSLARTATNSSTRSSVDIDWGTPGSLVGSPRPGYARPTGSLYNAPELRRLRNESLTSLMLPVEEVPPEVAWNIRPGMSARRQTAPKAKQPSRGSPNRDTEDDALEMVRRKPPSGTHAAPRRTPPKMEVVPGMHSSLLTQFLADLKAEQKRNKDTRRGEAPAPLKRTTTVRRADARRSAPESQREKAPTRDRHQPPDFKKHPQATTTTSAASQSRDMNRRMAQASTSKNADVAIASDSDDSSSSSSSSIDDDSQVLIRPSHKTYAQRRADSDVKGIRICRDGLWESEATKPF